MEGGPPRVENPNSIPELFLELDQLLEQMAEHQRTKVLEVARKRLPTVTAEDIMAPEGFPELYLDGPFNYEDGILNGLLTAQMALRARARQSDR